VTAGSHDDRGDPIEVGRVVKPHGLRGEVVVATSTDRPEVRFAPGAEVAVDGSVRTVASSRPHQGRWLVRLDGVTDRDGAEGLRGATLTAAPLVGDDETDTYWVHELVGMTVVTAESEDLGDVVSVVELPAAAGYDLLEVEHPDGHTWWLPAADELVEAAVTEDGDTLLVVVDPPAGLWEPDAQVALQPGDEVERPLTTLDEDG
jgi:16S rRNA processing protein RimM